MITQNDHARLSGLFAAHWGNRQFEKPRPFASSVRAAHYHDSGWFRYETNPRFDAETGKTLNYRDVPNDQAHLGSFQWAIDWLTGIDSYAGLLISLHRTGLWQMRYGVITQPAPAQRSGLSPEIEAFIARNEANQKAAAASLDQRELAVNYNLLQVWDLLSLYLCSHEALKEETIEPVPAAYGERNGVRMRLVPATPTRVAVEPYPFDQPALDVGVVYRRLRPSKFADAAAFQAAYFATPPQVASFMLCAAH